MQIAGKVFLLTGAGSGMGREMAHQLIAKGAKVAALDIHLPQLLETKQICSADETNFLLLEVDISNRAAVLALPDQVIAHFGHVDGIINNAGIIQPFVRVNDLSFDAIERVMNVNFYGTVAMVKAFLPHLLLRPEAHIVNISSLGGFLPVPGQSIYGASKAAIKLFSEGLYAELKETAVRVTLVFPGAIATNITVNSVVEVPSSPGSSGMVALPATDAARIILAGMENNQFHVFVGSDSKLMDILCRIAPEFATNFIRKKMKALLG
jgi:short-subunit dehydrogenase